MSPEKAYEDFVLQIAISATSRREIVKALINQFLEEKKGYWKDGKQVVTRYKYIVEETKQGNQIYLSRPAHPKVGADFQV